MRTSQRFASSLLLLMMLATATAVVRANGPGTPYPAASDISDQKAGSVLFYNLYSSNATNPALENTRINITNTSAFDSITVHLIFVDGVTCSPADATICLTQNQTASFTTADMDPGTMGYIVAVAVDRTTGCPTNFNFLIGDAYVKLASEHRANLAAEAISALNISSQACSVLDGLATLVFDGTQYNRLPQVLAVSGIASAVEGNSTLLVINNPSGNLATGANSVGAVFGILYNDAEIPASFTFNTARCQIKEVLSNNFPRTVPRFTSMIPAGRSGWMKLWSPSNRPLLGAVINYNSAEPILPSAFNHGHNLHKLTLLPSTSFTIPVFPSFC
jgi:hypothetical protein